MDPRLLGVDDGADLTYRTIELIRFVEDDVVEFFGAIQLVTGGSETLQQHVEVVGLARSQPVEQFFHRFRCEEDGCGTADAAPKGSGALDVDLDDDMLTGGESVFDRAAGDAIVVVVHQRMFDEIVGGDAVEEFLLAEEEVVDAIDFATSHRTCRGGDDIPCIGIMRTQSLDDTIFANTRRPGDDEHSRLAGGAEPLNERVSLTVERLEVRVPGQKGIGGVRSSQGVS